MPREQSSIRVEYLSMYGYADVAAIALARDLMRDDPKNFKRGYTRENAILAAQEVFPEAMEVHWEQEVIDDVGKILDGGKND